MTTSSVFLFHLRNTLLIAALLLLTACSHLSITGESAASLSSRRLSGLDSADILVANRSGTKVAFADRGLAVLDIGSGERYTLDATVPTAAGWSPDGSLLAAAFATAKDSRVKIYDRQGRVTAARDIGGTISGVFWNSASELSAVTVEVTEYKFGISYRVSLCRWPIGGEPASTVLHETTLLPMFQQKHGMESLYGITRPLLSPLGDELLYAKLMSPPLFAPYQKLVVRNLIRPAEREVASVGLAATGVMFGSDSEEVIYSDSDKKVLQRKIWGDDAVRKLFLSGATLAGSAGGRYLLADGQLYRDGKLLLTLPVQSRALFIPSGRLLVASDNVLYLVQGLEPDDAAEISREQLDKLVTIRAWRADGLITPVEYCESRKKVLQK